MKVKKLAVSVVILSAMCYLCICFDKVSLCVQNTLMLCCTNLIPALFPFFVLSDILMTNLNTDNLPLWIKLIYRKIFNMPESTLPVFISGLVSGYPVGASLTYNMYHSGNITKACAERLISITNNPGPMFVISVVGTGMFGSLRSGIVLYIIHIISVIVTSLISRDKYIKAKDIQTAHTAKYSIARIIEDDFMKAVKICGFVTIFAILNNGLCEIIGTKVGAVISSITEITSGIAQTAKLFPESIAMPLASFSLAFSGICVSLQVRSVTKYELGTKKYFKIKLLNGAISATLCTIYMKYFSPGASKESFHSSDMLINGLMICTYIMIGIYFITKSGNKTKKIKGL